MKKLYIPTALLMILLIGAGCVKKDSNVLTPGVGYVTSTPQIPEVTSTPTMGGPKKPTTLNGFVSFSDQTRKVSFSYPENWPKIVIADTADELAMEFKTRHDGTGILAQAIVRVSKTSQSQQDYNNYIKGILASFGPKKEGEEYSLTFENYAGVTNVLHLKSTNTKESPAYADSYAAIKNGFLYVISYQSTNTNYASDVALFKQVLTSFKIQ